MSNFDLKIGIGGAAGQGIAATGNIFAAIFARQGWHVFAYNAYQSLIRGGHTFLTIRTQEVPVLSHGDTLDILVCLNQDTIDRHLENLKPGSYVLFDGDQIQPKSTPDGVTVCALPVNELTGGKATEIQSNTLCVGAIIAVTGMDMKLLEEAMRKQFGRKGDALVADNMRIATLGYEYAKKHWKPLPVKFPGTSSSRGVVTGNMALAMGGAAAGVKFYCAYPMSPSTGVLHWMASHARELGIMVRQVEDEIGVINMAVGAAHAGARAMCATSGGGFALMTEGLGLAAMSETPLVVIDVQRGGPSTGIPTKTEQGDLWQMLGAGHGDYPRVIVAPTDILDCFHAVGELFNVVDKLQCPGIVLNDLILSEGHTAIAPEEMNWTPVIDRGELILDAKQVNMDQPYLRYKDTPSGVSPRAVPGLPGLMYTLSSDEHDEDGVLISDEYTNPHKRKKMMDKRMRKMDLADKLVPAPKIDGPADAKVTLVGWGSTKGVIAEACAMLRKEGVAVNHLQVKWLVPLHGEEIKNLLSRGQKTIMIEQNYSGQFARYLRGETGYDFPAHIRKYDGEPFMPHHIVDGVKEILAGKTKIFVPTHEIMV